MNFEIAQRRSRHADDPDGPGQTGKSEQVLRRIGELGDSSRQILLVPEHASHQAEVDLCRACGDTASRHAEVLSFRRLCDRVLTHHRRRRSGDTGRRR